MPGGRHSAELEVQAGIGRDLCAAIRDGEFAPGQRLFAAELAERFGASRHIIHVVLQNLASLGIVEFHRHRGARLRGVSLDEAIEITELRKTVEGHIAARAAARATLTDASELSDIVADLGMAVTGGDLLRHRDLDGRLRACLRQISDQPWATQVAEQLETLTARHSFSASLMPGQSAASLRQLAAVVEAVLAGEPRAAERAMHLHLDGVASAIASLRSP